MNCDMSTNMTKKKLIIKNFLSETNKLQRQVNVLTFSHNCVVLLSFQLFFLLFLISVLYMLLTNIFSCFSDITLYERKKAPHNV